MHCVLSSVSQYCQYELRTVLVCNVWTLVLLVSEGSFLAKVRFLAQCTLNVSRHAHSNFVL